MKTVTIVLVTQMYFVKYVTQFANLRIGIQTGKRAYLEATATDYTRLHSTSSSKRHSKGIVFWYGVESSSGISRVTTLLVLLRLGDIGVAFQPDLPIGMVTKLYILHPSSYKLCCYQATYNRTNHIQVPHPPTLFPYWWIWPSSISILIRALSLLKIKFVVSGLSISGSNSYTSCGVYGVSRVFHIPGSTKNSSNPSTWSNTLQSNNVDVRGFPSLVSFAVECLSSLPLQAICVAIPIALSVSSF